MNLKLKNITIELIYILISLTIILLICFIFYTIQENKIEDRTNLQKSEALNIITYIKNSTEKELNSILLYTNLFANIISQNTNINENTLQQYAAETLDKNASIKSIVFSPNLIANVTYPEGQNTKAIATNNTVLHGHIQDVQSGNLIFSRKAIYYKENNINQFWGLVSLVIDFDKMIKNNIKNFNDKKYLIAIRVYNQNKDSFFLASEIFEKNSIIERIQLLDYNWEFAIYPKYGWKDENSFFDTLNIWYIIFIIILFILINIIIKNLFLKLNKAKKDLLTNTLNKVAFKSIINKRIKNKRNHFSFLLFDINGFKQINDNLGHYIGDCVLIEISRRLEYLLRKRDLLSRFGGDEYIMFINGVENQSKINHIINRIQRRIKKPMIFENYVLEINISIGYSFFPNDATSYDELYKIADKNMYEFKKSNQYKKSTFENGNKCNLTDINYHLAINDYE